MADWRHRSSSPASLHLAHHRNTAVESPLQAAERENARLQTENSTLKAAYSELANAVPALVALTSNPFGLPTSGHSLTTAPLPPLREADYPLVRFWHRTKFTKSDGVSPNTGPSRRGATAVSQGINVTGQFIEDENGQVVDGFRVSAILKVAGHIWHGFVKGGIAPPTWGQASIAVITLYNNEMCRQFPELRYCAENWKARKLATTNYSSWYTTHGTPRAAKEQPKGKRRIQSPPPDIRKKVKLDDEGLLSFNPLWEPSLSTPAAPAATTPVGGAVLIVASTPPPLPLPTVLSNGEGGDVHAPSDSTAVQPVVVGPSSSGSADVSALSHAALIASAFPPPLPPVAPSPVPAVAPPPVSAAASGAAPKKDAKMTSSKAMTARNLCAKVWITEHHGTRIEFSRYWDSITGSAKETYWNVQSTVAKSGGTPDVARGDDNDLTFGRLSWCPLISNVLDLAPSYYMPTVSVTRENDVCLILSRENERLDIPRPTSIRLRAIFTGVHFLRGSEVWGSIMMGDIPRDIRISCGTNGRGCFTEGVGLWASMAK
ncbi:hypothetical protein C8F04DRAFT_1180207 [Mycena alexandri]|uniref:Uncharacterized protein n=1 Tax=Mycena alexandri TaxID=1745969 RepID=A0AAD6T1R5_9AGAR|nr:hypothetical protein C8F04DRAFT_1180207 [Mycena alexandri]